MLRLVQAADVTSESNALDPSAIDICTVDTSANHGNCPNDLTGQDLLCRLFTILPLATNTVNLATSTALLTDFDYADTEKGNDNSIVTVVDNGCKSCRHADGIPTALSFAYDTVGDPTAVPAVAATYKITATCACSKTGETANTSPDDPTDPFECICDADQERFQRILVGH